MNRLSFLAFLLLSLSGKAQPKNDDDYAKFEKTFISNVTYPVDLISNCKPVICLLKISCDERYNIQNMEVSDSADSLFKIEFAKNMDKLDIFSLKSFLTKEFAGTARRTYIIPVSYVILHRDSCPPQAFSASIFESYYKFNDKQVYGGITLLRPIAIKLMINN